MQQEVVDAGALDSSLLPDLASDVCRGPAVEKRDEVGQRAHDAALSYVFSVLAESVAGDEPCDEARGKIVEATEEAILPVSRHFSWLHSRDITNCHPKKKFVKRGNYPQPEIFSCYLQPQSDTRFCRLNVVN